MYAIDIGTLNFYRKRCLNIQTRKYGNVAPDKQKTVSQTEKRKLLDTETTFSFLPFVIPTYTSRIVLLSLRMKKFRCAASIN